jgi:hypothetical protein
MFSAAGKSAVASGYFLNNSLRFRSSATAYLNRTFATPTNNKIWTLSLWVKRSTLTTTQILFGTASEELRYIADDGASGVVDSFQYNAGAGYGFRASATYRDVSAWYHLVIATDTTQATAANRVKFYVNGVQATTDGTYDITQNTNTQINSAVAHNIGRRNSGSLYFDGYMTEINFVDGQALTPSSFGETSTTTGSWIPKAYTGTYGTNGFYLKFNQGLSTSYAGAFNGTSQYLTVADNAALELGSSNFCVETWVNYNSLAGSGGVLFGKIADNTSATGAWVISKNSNTGSMNFYATSNGSSYDMFNQANIGTLTAGTWNHIAVYRSGNTFYGALNGVVTVLGTSSSSIFNNTSAVGIGAAADGGGKVASSISNTRIVTGSAVYGTSTFTPPTSALTAITGTQLLTLQNATIIDNSTNAFTITNNGTTTTSVSYPFSTVGIGADSSPNFNNWTSNNISLTAGVTYDAMTDVPTLTSATVGNYAVINPLQTYYTNATLSNGNLNFSGGTSGIYALSTINISTGKWYCEFVFTTISGATSVVDCGFLVPGGANAVYYKSDSLKGLTSGESAYGASYTINDVIGMAVDFETKNVTFYKNGTSQGTFSFSTESWTGDWAFHARTRGTTTYAGNINFGQRPFAYTPPTGYKALNTYNLPDSTIVKGNKYMDATTYTGTGATLSVTNAGTFKPDFVWMKGRSNVRNNNLYDSVRGTTKELNSNTTGAETTNATGLTAFNSNGWTIGSDGGINTSSETYVGWQWQAGQGTTTVNTSGSISSNVSVNATAGFSVVTYTGTGSAATVGHGLGVAPKMVITKKRSDTSDWAFWITGFAGTELMELNGTGTKFTGATVWNSTTPTPTVFSVGSATQTNNSGGTYVAYLWSEIAGFSKFGSYTGNGSANGPFVYTGFRPKFILAKDSSFAGQEWTIYDTSRSTYNQAGNMLSPTLSAAETVWDGAYDILSNGFKLRTTDARENRSGSTFIYAAFAENPFKNSNAR